MFKNERQKDNTTHALQIHTIRMCNNYCFSTTKMVMRTHVVTLYIYWLYSLPFIYLSMKIEYVLTYVKEGGQCTCKWNIDAPSRRHCFRGKKIRIKFPECVCSLTYPAFKAHASYYIVICGLSGCTIFFPIYYKQRDFLKKKKKVFKIKSVSFYFFTNFFETFLVLENYYSGIIVNVHKSSRKVPRYSCQIGRELGFFSTDFRNYWNIKFHENPSSGCQWESSCSMRRNGQTCRT
jgi:hypothetical protein